MTLSSGGTYYWQAVYSGDSENQTSTSTCGSETETVTSAVTPKPTQLKTLLHGTGSWNGRAECGGRRRDHRVRGNVGH